MSNVLVPLELQRAQASRWMRTRLLGRDSTHQLSRAIVSAAHNTIQSFPRCHFVSLQASHLGHSIRTLYVDQQPTDFNGTLRLCFVATHLTIESKQKYTSNSMKQTNNYTLPRWQEVSWHSSETLNFLKRAMTFGKWKSGPRSLAVVIRRWS